MSIHIEWGELYNDGRAQAELIAPGEAEDAYGSTNESHALYIGECVIEGTPDQWITFAEALLESAQTAKQAENDDRECVQCGDTPQYLSTRGWCDGCEEEDAQSDPRFEV